MKKLPELNSSAHLQNIDMLRAIAIIAVFLFHAINCLFHSYAVKTYTAAHTLDLAGTKNYILNFNPIAFGWSGVQLFLLISGFLIHLGYLRNKEAFSVSTFYSKRFWRIYPPYFIVLLFFCIFKRGLVYYFFTKEGLVDFFSHAFLVHNFSDTTILTIDGPFWSLALEMQLYLIYPLLLYLRNKTGMNKTFMWIVALSLVLQVVGIITNNFGTVNSYDWSVFKMWFVWAAGALLAERYYNKQTLFNNRGLVYSLLFFVVLTVSKYYSFANYFQYYFATAMWLAFFEWFILSEKIKVTNWLARCFVTIGLCSYSIYLIHLPFLRELMGVFNLTHYSVHSGMVKYLNILPKPLFAFLIVFLISYSMYVFIEQKSIAFGKRLRERKG